MEDKLKRKIMKRVYAIWFFKRVAPALFVYLPFLLFVALRETASEFFVARIVDNFLLAVNAGFVATARFALSALSNTPVLPTLIILVSLGVFAVLLRKLARNFKQVHLAKSLT